jgi:hypothetical protein
VPEIAGDVQYVAGSRGDYGPTVGSLTAHVGPPSPSAAAVLHAHVFP